MDSHEKVYNKSSKIDYETEWLLKYNYTILEERNEYHQIIRGLIKLLELQNRSFRFYLDINVMPITLFKNLQGINFIKNSVNVVIKLDFYECIETRYKDDIQFYWNLKSSILNKLIGANSGNLKFDLILYTVGNKVKIGNLEIEQIVNFLANDGIIAILKTKKIDENTDEDFSCSYEYFMNMLNCKNNNLKILDNFDSNSFSLSLIGYS